MQFKKTHGFGIRSIVTRCGQYDAFYKFRTPGHIPSAPCVQLMHRRSFSTTMSNFISICCKYLVVFIFWMCNNIV